VACSEAGEAVEVSEVSEASSAEVAEETVVAACLISEDWAVSEADP